MATTTYTVPLRSTGTAYLWWFFFGTFGAHQFYLGRPLRGLIYAFTFGLLWLGVIWDLFTLPSQVRQVNRDLMNEYGPR